MTGNRKSMTKIIVLCCFAALSAFAGMAQANDGGCGGGGQQFGKHQPHEFQKLEKKLGLSDEQKAKAKTIFQGNREAMKPVFESMHAERKVLQSLIKADTIDEAAIRAETAKIAGIQADLNVNRAKVGAQFRAILTPTQLAILKTMPRNGHKKHGPMADHGE